MADALSRLDMDKTPNEDTQESFLALMEYFGKTNDVPEFHPLNYQQLCTAQEADKIQENSKYGQNAIFYEELSLGQTDPLAHLL